MRGSVAQSTHEEATRGVYRAGRVRLAPEHRLAPVERLEDVSKVLI
jgi:hypothetical protein